MGTEFFVDRSLGRHRVPVLLRASGWTLRTHHEIYGARDEHVRDVDWLEMCGTENLVVLSKDRRLRYRPAEIAAIRRHGVMAFVLVRAGLRAAEQAARFDHNRDVIETACVDPGPFVYAVHSDRISRIYP
jgi:hypothetical protein